MKTFALVGGSLAVFEAATDAAGKALMDAGGKPLGASWSIEPAQIGAHRRDPDFEKALQAAAAAVGAAPELVALAAVAPK